MSNHLAGESSPYLLQHRDNPVEWYPWGDAAIGRAQGENKPIFLSIGYAACHWCHVMERESFTNPAIASILNEHFVAIKVDREERPEIDQIYMRALQIYFQMTGSPQGGGWPLSMFLTPDREPFLGGTYWPPHARHGRPGFDEVLGQVAKLWSHDPQRVLQQARDLTSYLRRSPVGGGPAGAAGFEPAGGVGYLRAAAAVWERSFDPDYGGFGGAPKFPHPLGLEVLLRLWKRTGDDTSMTMVRRTLDGMARGGIYDQLGGGFARYAVDARWLVPHFEKMLYDNALLAKAYLLAHQATGSPGYATIVRETLDYVLRDMTDPLGGFYSSEDADSEGEEGRFYVWTPAELLEVLGADAASAVRLVYNVTEDGNFQGANVLHRPRELAACAEALGLHEQELSDLLLACRTKLLAARDRRVRPARDDKVLVNWNGLMIDAMARAAATFGEPRYLEVARRAARFLLDHLRDDRGRLRHTWRAGRARIPALLDDHACLIEGLVSLYQANFDEGLLDDAVRLADDVLEHFSDPDACGFFTTADDHPPLITRPKEIVDSSVPSGNAMAATALLRLGRLCGVTRYTEVAERVIAGARDQLEQFPTAMAQMLLAIDSLAGPVRHIVVVGAPRDPEIAALLATLNKHYLPDKLVAVRAVHDAASGPPRPLDALFRGKPPVGGTPTVYVCENHTCQQPVTGGVAMRELGRRLADR